MDPLSAVLTLKALDGLSARAEVTAHNIANAQTPGFRPLRVSFEAALAAAAPLGPDAVGAVRPQTETASGQSGDGALRLDQEMATAASTALRYGALIEILDRQMQLSRLAVTGGR